MVCLAFVAQVTALIGILASFALSQGYVKVPNSTKYELWVLYVCTVVTSIAGTSNYLYLILYPLKITLECIIRKIAHRVIHVFARDFPDPKDNCDIKSHAVTFVGMTKHFIFFFILFFSALLLIIGAVLFSSLNIVESSPASVSGSFALIIVAILILVAAVPVQVFWIVCKRKRT